MPKWLRRRAPKQDHTGSNPEEVNFFSSSIIDLGHHKYTIPQLSLNSFVNHAFKNLTIQGISCLSWAVLSILAAWGIMFHMQYPPYIRMSVYEVVEYVFENKITERERDKNN